MSKTRQTVRTPALAVGDRVFVKPGVTDPDHPDMPIGGWSGVIKEVDASPGEILYLIEWDERTLDAMHPVFRKRCEADDLDEREMYLAEENVEKLVAEPPPIERPTKIVPRTLSPKNEDDRIRMAFGLTGDDPIPDVCGETLRTYHAYLMKHLSFPFDVEFSFETGFLQSKTIHLKVSGLADPEDADELYGLFCTAKVGRGYRVVPLADVKVKQSGKNAELIDDYGFWFSNWR
jgi:hypothetical protein